MSLDERNVFNTCQEHVRRTSDQDPDLVKVRVLIPEDTGWQGIEAEWLWAEQMKDGTFALRNYPLYAYGLSFGDVFETTNTDGTQTLTQVVSRGGHSTYRIIASKGLDQPDVQSVLEKLKSMECDFEVGNRIHLVLDVPPATNIFAVYDLLEKSEALGLFEFEEGHCGHPVK